MIGCIWSQLSGMQFIPSTRIFGRRIHKTHCASLSTNLGCVVRELCLIYSFEGKLCKTSFCLRARRFDQNWKPWFKIVPHSFIQRKMFSEVLWALTCSFFEISRFPNRKNYFCTGWLWFCATILAHICKGDGNNARVLLCQGEAFCLGTISIILNHWL